MSTTIEVHDLGPVTEFEYAMDSPGLHVLRGKQGCGKSTVLRTVQLVTDGRTDQTPTKRDGAKRGEATVAGKTVKISKQIREEGELTVDGLGDLDLTVLHSPKFNDAATRDRYRIKALVRLSGVKADASLFHDLLGGRESFDELVDAAATETDDLVEMSAKVKRSIEKAALATEAKVETAKANFRAKMDCCEGIDFQADHDEKKLADALQGAVATHSRLSTQRDNALKVKRQAADSAAQLAKIEKSYTGSTVEKARDDHQLAKDFLIEQADMVSELEKNLAAAQAELAVRQERERTSKAKLEAAESHERSVAALKEAQAQAQAVECPTEDEVDGANVAVHVATQDVQSGVRIRDAIASRDAATQYMQDANSFDETAKALRKAAASTFDVLSDAITSIPGCPLRVWNNEAGDSRLVIDTDRDDREPFDDLSDGEKWNVIVPMCFARNRLIVLPQAAFGEIQPANCNLLDNLAIEHDSYILTAQVDDGELRGEKYTNGKA